MLKLTFSTLLLLSLGVIAHTQEKKDPPTPTPAVMTKELTRIQGKWKATKVNFGGVEIPPDEMARKKMIFEFKGNEMNTFDNGREEKSGKVKLDSTKTPSEFDLDNDKTKMQGIYREDVTKGTIEICLALGEKRPTKFESTKEAPTILITMEKTK